MKLQLFILCLLIAEIGAKPWMDTNDTPRERAKKILDEMTTKEKILMVHGEEHGIGELAYVGHTNANTRLGIPPLNLEDGPQGVADGVLDVTCWPSTLTVTATFDVARMEDYARAMAIEQRGKGTNVMLGPCVNIARVPYGGRTFEGMGEDPYVASAMVVPYVKGVQGQNVIANVKHFVDNSQETDRHEVSENVPQRAQYELYYPAFKAAVDAGVGSVMCSYNKINNTWACENEETIKDLKSGMGFDGWVVSDWKATHTTIEAANAGLDQEMPGDAHFGWLLEAAIDSGVVKKHVLDDKVLRILTQMFAIGLFDIPQPTGHLDANVTSPEHAKLAQDLAVEGTVLLKNDGNLLPLSITTKNNVAVIGMDAKEAPVVTGGGSGKVLPPYISAPLDAIIEKVGSFSNVTYVAYDVGEAKIAAGNADYAIVFASALSSEGSDRPTLGLDEQEELIRGVASINPNTIVVLHVCGAVTMPWIESVPSVITAFMPGQESGHAIVRILYGEDNPSGRLPLTFPKNEKEIPVNTTEQYPGVHKEVTYSEDLNVGYRWYDAMDVEPLFPFGHGLSYTTFEYSNLKVSKDVTATATVNVEFDVENTGKFVGAEVPQLYIGYPDSAGEPPKQLRGFTKLPLQLGEKKHVTFNVDISEDLKIWDVAQQIWTVVPGKYLVYVGASSRDVRLDGEFDI